MDSAVPFNSCLRGRYQPGKRFLLVGVEGIAILYNVYKGYI
jgi:hypothetical protein